MENLSNAFNNRELAILTWIAIAIFIAIFSKAFREFLGTAFKIVTSKTFGSIIILLIAYLFFLIWGIHKINLWGFHLLKDTIFWLFTVGFTISFKSIGKDIDYFKKLVYNSIKLTIILEFIVNLHVFSYIAEFISLPILLFVSVLIAVNERQTKDIRVGRFLNFIVGIYGLVVLIFAIYETIGNYLTDFTIENLQSLVLPSILTISFIPFAYLVSVFSAYEILFTKLYNVKNEKFSKSTIKWKIIKRNKLNLKRIGEMNLLLNPYYINRTDNIDQYLNELKKT